MGYSDFLCVGLIIILVTATGCAAGEIPAIVLQNEHQSLTADFIGDLTSGEAPLRVSFTDLSAGSPGEWLWNFGDGIQENHQNPEHTYLTPGKYSVSLSVTGPSGSDRKTRLGYISVLASDATSLVPESDLNMNTGSSVLPEIPVSQILSQTPVPTPTSQEPPASSPTLAPSPTGPAPLPTTVTSQTDLLNLFTHPVHADFTSSVTSGKIPLTVRFTDISAGGGLSRIWDFGDGNTSSGESVEHTYVTAGLYTVKLTVQGEQGSDTALRHDLIDVTTDPIATFSALPRNGSAPLSVGFVDQSTGRITSRVWTFGDGTSSNETSPVHMYTNPGIYSVSLAINGPDGSAEKTVSDLVLVTGTIQEPRASIMTDVTSGPSPLTVQFTDISSGDVTIRTWDFGEGSTTSENTVSHTFASPGEFPVSLLIKGPAGESTAEVLITVTAPDIVDTLPVASFTADKTEGTAPLMVQFTGTSSGNITSRTWDFGDGSSSSEKNPSHEFDTPGLYLVNLTVRSPDGLNSFTTLITVGEQQLPQSAQPLAGFSSDSTEGTAPLFIRFQDTSTGDITSWNWEFGDGTTSNEQHPTHEFTVPGSYPVQLRVIGPAGENSSVTTITVRTVQVPVSPPVAGYIADLTEGTAPLAIRFQDTSTGDITSWNWEFSDGTTSNEQHPTHEFTVPGSYPVQLMVRGPGGENSTQGIIAVREHPVTISPPVAGYIADLTEGTAPLAIRFQDTSMGDVTSWNWEFGDGTTSAEQHPTHEFTVPGSYPVQLMVTGPGGENSTRGIIAVREHPVTISPPVAGYIADLTEGTAPLFIRFQDISSGEITAWKWDFGDENQSSEQNPIHIYTSPGSFVTSLTITGPGGVDVVQKTISVHKFSSPPVASFNSDISGGNAPLTVIFTDTSSGEITGRTWDFGDGTTSGELNPTHRYLSPGQYPVVLSLTGPNGDSRADGSIMVRPPAALDEDPVTITPDRYEGTAPLSVSFSVGTTGEITEWSWNFGDQNISTEQRPVHVYSEPGSYTVTFLGKGPNGVRRADTVIFVNPVTAPAEEKLKADFFIQSTEGAAPFMVSPRDTSKGDISGWLWDFGDGSTSDEQNPKHTYSVPGTYPVVLSVTGPAGQTHSDASLILVTNSLKQPWAEIMADKTVGESPLTVSFTDSSIGEITGWSWDFGDGTTTDEQNPVHVFTIAGTYVVTLRVSGPGGTGQGETSILVTAPEPEPVAVFNVSSTRGEAPMTVLFTDSSTGNITKWTWDFGDKSGISDQNPVHTYQEPGNYTAALSVSGPGGIAYTEQNILVTAEKTTPGADISAKKTDGVVPFRVHLYPVLSGRVDGYLWDLGDGTVSYDKEPVHVYDKPGIYSIKLTISGSDGVYTVEKPGYITARSEAYPPNATISSDTLSGPVPLNTTFIATADEPVDTYEWLFGDGESGTGEVVQHTYGKTGIYDVTLIAKGPGGTDTEVAPACITVTNAVIPIHASISATTEYGVVPLNVTFTPQVTGVVDAYLWEFGDNTTSSEGVPSHMYIEPGLYTVNLSLIGPSGNYSTSLNHQITVTGMTNPPVAKITADITNGSAPLHVTLNADINGTADGYVWDFGDGASAYEVSPTHAYAIPGNYTVRLTVSGPEGSSESRLQEPIVVYAGEKIPVTGFTATPVSGVAPLHVSFTDTSSGTIRVREWDFGDGTSSSEINPFHLYEKPGTYTVTLRASGQAGRSEEMKEGFITIYEPPKPPVARFSADTRFGSVPLTISLHDMSSGEITSWNWDLGDGNVSSEQNPVNIYTRPGEYTVNETVHGPGGEDSALRRGYIIVTPQKEPPSAAIYAEPEKGTAPLTVRFLDMSEGIISTWNWDFGDSSSSQYKNPTHIYQKPGTYKVQLKVTGPQGESISEVLIRISASDTRSGSESFLLPRSDPLTGETTPETGKGNGTLLEFSVPVMSEPGDAKPVAEFSLFPRNGTAPLTVSFSDSSTGNISAWSWTFGDGLGSPEQSPVYTYRTPGTYTISLTVSGPDGSSSKRIRDIVEVW